MKRIMLSSLVCYVVLLCCHDGSALAQGYVLKDSTPVGTSIGVYVAWNYPAWDYDINGDGRQDLALATWSTNTIQVWSYDGSNSSLIWTNAFGDTAATLFGFYDFDGDGTKEAAIRRSASNYEALQLIDWQTNTTELMLANLTTTSPHGVVFFFTDIDGDSRTDIIAACGDGSSTHVEIWGVPYGPSATDQNEPPKRPSMSQNYPNPFNPSTKIDYLVETRGHIEIKIYSAKGEMIKTLVSGNKEPGKYSTIWDGKNDAGQSVASGAYFYALVSSRGMLARKMIILR